MTEVEKKAKRGRPSNKKVSTLSIRGIISEPSNIHTAECPELTNYMELVYNNPSVLTRIFRLFKQYKCEMIRFVFEPTRVSIYSRDHLNKNTILIEIDCTLMNSYYLADTLVMNLDSSIIFEVMKSVDTNHDYISFSTTCDSYDRLLTIALVDCTTGEKGADNIEINIVDNENDVGEKLWADIAKESTYPLSFEFTHKKFKNYVNKWDSLALNNTIHFEKIPNEPLAAKCPRKDGRGNHEIIYTNDDYINLVDNTTGIFEVGIKLDFIKFYSTSLLSEKVNIQLDYTMPMILTSHIDPVDDKPRFKVKVVSDLE